MLRPQGLASAFMGSNRYAVKSGVATQRDPLRRVLGQAEACPSEARARYGRWSIGRTFLPTGSPMYSLNGR